MSNNSRAESLHFCVAGKNSIALFTLNLLREKYPNAVIEVLFNRNDHGFDTWQPSFKKYAETLGYQETTIESLYTKEKLIFLSVEFDRIINPEKFSSSNLFNIHFSLLPAYKGMYTSAWPLINGEKFSGVTLHEIDAGIDTGDVVDQRRFEIPVTWNGLNLYEKYLLTAEDLLRENIDSLVSGEYSAVPQSQLGSTYYSSQSINYSNIEINLKHTAFEISNLVRAFCFRHFQLPRIHGKPISDWKITEKKSTSKPGTLVTSTDFSITISTIDYDLVLGIDPYELLWEWSENKQNGYSLAQFLDLGINLETQNSSGWTALMIAAFNGNFSQVEALCSAGANLNATNYKGTTVLMYAFSHYEATQDPQIFKFLIKNGADYFAKDIAGKTIEDYAYERQNQELLKLLR
ncbi:MAG: hypothetical protein RLY59_1164 [Actinomycetota bacterium]|jgi:methionyl-tRNA formyltransferase